MGLWALCVAYFLMNSGAIVALETAASGLCVSVFVILMALYKRDLNLVCVCVSNGNRSLPLCSVLSRGEDVWSAAVLDLLNDMMLALWNQVRVYVVFLFFPFILSWVSFVGVSKGNGPLFECAFAVFCCNFHANKAAAALMCLDSEASLVFIARSKDGFSDW